MIDLKAHSAFAAFFQTMQSQGVPQFADMTYPLDENKPTSRQSAIQAAMTAKSFRLPNIICRAEKFMEISEGCNVYRGLIYVIISSSLEDDTVLVPNDPDGNTLHSTRAQAAFQCLFDVSKNEGDPVGRALALPYLNQPASGPDTRTIKDFTCSCYTFVEPLSGWDDRHVESTLVIEVTCSNGDPV